MDNTIDNMNGLNYVEVHLDLREFINMLMNGKTVMN